jgi:hypothetical protein
MKKSLLDTLTEDNATVAFDSFCNYIASNKQDTSHLVTTILNGDEYKDKYKLLKRLVWFFNIELHGRHLGDDFNFEVSDFSKSVKKYLYSWDRFGRKGIPQEEWSDFVDEGINLLKILIDENKLEQFKEDQRYRDFMKRFIQRHEDLRLSGKYPDLNELMDD